MSTKLLLFDLDGTLLHARNGHMAFSRAMDQVFGVTFRTGEMRTDGMTDQAIVQQLLARAGQERTPTRREIETLEELHSKALAEAIEKGEIRLEAETGVKAILDRLAAIKDYRLAVVTGNFAPAAAVKLGSVGLARYFQVGAYGSDHIERAEIAALGRKRAQAHWGEEIPARRCIIIGDTQRDLVAARANGMPTMLVATGRTPYEELARLGSEVLIRDWTDENLVLEKLAEI